MHIALATGPEVISGSPRMKAGTATKLVLNSFSTTLMIRMGRTYSNLMVSVNALNSKLRAGSCASSPRRRAWTPAPARTRWPKRGEHPRRTGLLLGEVPAARATTVLEETDGGVREALQRLRSA